MAASRRSPALTILYRSNTLRVLCPVICIATRSGMPARTRFRTAVPAEIVQDASRASSFRTGRSECGPEALDGPARTVDHTRADNLEPPLKILGNGSLLFKRFTQLSRHRERASLSVLGSPRIEPDFTSAEVHLAPLERQELAVDPPAGDVRESRAGRTVSGKPPRSLPRSFILFGPDWPTIGTTPTGRPLFRHPERLGRPRARHPQALGVERGDHGSRRVCVRRCGGPDGRAALRRRLPRRRRRPPLARLLQASLREEAAMIRLGSASAFSPTARIAHKMS